jgi:hypothetical protein
VDALTTAAGVVARTFRPTGPVRDVRQSRPRSRSLPARRSSATGEADAYCTGRPMKARIDLAWTPASSGGAGIRGGGCGALVVCPFQEPVTVRPGRPPQWRTGSHHDVMRALDTREQQDGERCAPRSLHGVRQHISSGSPFEPTIGFSRAVRHEQLVFVSATAAIWPDGHVDPDVGVQARRCLEIIDEALRGPARRLVR